MPLTPKGQKIKSAMQNTYGAKKGEQVFYASKNAGKLSGVEGTPTKTGRTRGRPKKSFVEKMEDQDAPV